MSSDGVSPNHSNEVKARLPDFIYERCNNTFPPLPYPPEGSRIRVSCCSIRSTIAAKASIVFTCLTIMGAFVAGVLLTPLSPAIALGCLVGSVVLALLTIAILSVSTFHIRGLRYQAETRLTDEINCCERLLRKYNSLVDEYNSLLTDTESIDKKNESRSEFSYDSEYSCHFSDESSSISPSDSASQCQVYRSSRSTSSLEESRGELQGLRNEIRKLCDAIFLLRCELSPIKNPYCSPNSLSSCSSSSSSS